MFGLLLTLCLHLTFGLVQKETTLNAELTSHNGASIIHNHLTAHVSGTNYNVIVDNKDDIGYDIKLSLNNSWSFQPAIKSSITLTINGNTPYPHIDTDFMLVFSVNNLQYFSFFVHLDNINIKSRIYPSLSMQKIQPVSEWISNNTILSRWDRISNNNQWLPSNWNKQALWPLKFVIINDPINDEIIFEFYNQISQQYATGYIFNESSFDPNKYIDVYMMGDSNGERYNVSSFNILLSYNDSNNSTVIPTNQPTLSVTNGIMNITKMSNYAYGISVIVLFEYIFCDDELNKIIIILQDFTLHSLNDNINNCMQWLKQTTVQNEKENITIINATIFSCDELTQNELLIAVNNGHLKNDIINDINQKLQSRQINSNKTFIQANRLNIFHMYTNSTKTTDLINITIADKTDKMIMYYIFWMIIFITIPIIACCLFLSYLKMRVKKKENEEIQQNVNLSLQIDNISKVQESDDDQTEDFNRQNSSKLYKLRRYNKPINKNEIDTVSANTAIKQPSTPKSPKSPISPRTYKTRGISEDIYDCPNGETCGNDLYGEGNIISTLHPKLSMSSRINANSYPNVSAPTSPHQTIKLSSNYKLPQYHVTKRQWL